MINSSIERASRIVGALKSLKPGRRPRSPVRQDVALARALFWEKSQIESRPVGLPFVRSLTRVNVGGQGAAVFAFSQAAKTSELVNGVALYAYQASIEWGLVANSSALTIFNSHWVRHESWFELPAVEWDRIDGAVDMFEALTPTGLTYGEMERVAVRFWQPERVLQPVDDALVSRLDFWRNEIARYSPALERADELIHRLFAQLFVLRSAEDRRLSTGLGSLLTAEGLPLDRFGLKRVFAFARTHLQSELFRADIIDGIPDEVLSGVITDLYFPRHLPVRNARYNFAWIDADVLGRAYEKYLSQILHAGAAATQLRLLQNEQPIREIKRVGVRKGAGIYYTPQFLVSYLVKECIDRHFAAKGSGVPTMLDPSCGSGSFLTAGVSYLIQKLGGNKRGRNCGRELITKKKIYGVDSDPRAVLLARLSLWLRLAEEPSPLPLPALDDVIIEGDSLSPETWRKLPREFDVVVGNPPFAPMQLIPSRADLESRFVTARGRFDFAYLFLELGVRKLALGGQIGMVVPNRLFKNRDAGPTRDFLTSNLAIEMVTDFGSIEVFKDVSAYIGTIVGAKRAATGGEVVKFTRVLMLAPLMNLLLGEAAHKELVNRFVQSFDTQHPRGPNAWLFLSPATRSARLRLEAQSVPLPEIAEIFQGIKVGANDLFIVSAQSQSASSVISVRNGLGDVYPVESALLHPVVYGPQIEAYKPVAPTSYLLYPYANGAAIEEDELAAQYPLTYRYLSDYRRLLETRTSVITSGRKWYELVRQRDESLMQRPKLLMRDLAIATAFAFDEVGDTYLVGGTAVVPNDPTLLKPLLAYLNSVLTNWYLAPMTPGFRAEFQKFEPQHLSNIPVLSDVLENEMIQAQLSSLADSAIESLRADEVEKYDRAKSSVDRLLCRIVGVDPGA